MKKILLICIVVGLISGCSAISESYNNSSLHYWIHGEEYKTDEYILN